jgi:hypothetical protein
MMPNSATDAARHAAPAASDPTTEALLAGVRGNPVAMINFARTFLLTSNRVAQARDLCREALALDPGSPRLKAMAQPVLSHGIGSWYYTMVQDDDRHALYERAFAKVIRPGCTVLDIGAGTGLFAMMAARAGAGRVIACERDEPVADAARAIVAANGLSDKVTIQCKDSRELRIGEDMDEPADVLLWDNLANNLFGVGCAGTIEDARARLVKPDAPILPWRTEVMVAPARDLQPENRRMGDAHGFDMRAFNALHPASLTMPRPQMEVIGDGAVLFDVNFGKTRHFRADEGAVTVDCAAGRIDGVAQWLRFHLADDIIYDTSAETVTAFGTQFHPIETVELTAARPVTIGGGHDCANTWFWIER